MIRTILFTALALVCFAANSILCRLALRSGSIDPAGFTAMRLLSGAVVLALIVLASGKKPLKAGTWLSGGMLFLYAIAFGLAYVSLNAGTGALILFGSVQATMIIASMVAKKHPSPAQWIGLLLALGGLVYLVLPGLSSPPIDRALMMAVAGIAWGVYSLRGPGGDDAVASTAGNFLRATPLALIPLVLMLNQLHASPLGIMWAVLSGAVTSGIGYVFWYTALPGLGSIRGATVQLTVPVLTAAAGILLLHETLTPRLMISTAAILLGVGLTVAARRKS
jgi:drug/metabolite transporter (DMT)-like permease